MVGNNPRVYIFRKCAEYKDHLYVWHILRLFRLPSFDAQICSLLFLGSSTSTSTSTSTIHSLQKSGWPLHALTQGAMLSGRMIAPTLNKKTNILTSIYFIVFLVGAEKYEFNGKTSFEKLDWKDLQLEQSQGDLRLPLLRETKSRLSSLSWSFCVFRAP